MTSTSDTVSTAVEQAKAQAIGYVWGRQDMGEPGDTERSIAFGEAYAERKRAFLAEENVFMPNIRDAYMEWAATGSIALRAGCCRFGRQGIKHSH